MKVKPAKARSSAEIGPLYDNDPVPLPEPVRPAVLGNVRVPPATDKRQVPRQVERSGIRILQGDAVARGSREDQRLTGNIANKLRRRLEDGPSQRRDFGGVAFGVGGRGGDHGRPAPR